MGITANSNETQLWSVIPYAVATPVTGKLRKEHNFSKAHLMYDYQCWSPSSRTVSNCEVLSCFSLSPSLLQDMLS